MTKLHFRKGWTNKQAEVFWQKFHVFSLSRLEFVGFRSFGACFCLSECRLSSLNYSSLNTVSACKDPVKQESIYVMMHFICGLTTFRVRTTTLCCAAAAKHWWKNEQESGRRRRQTTMGFYFWLYNIRHIHIMLWMFYTTSRRTYIIAWCASNKTTRRQTQASKKSFLSFLCVCVSDVISASLILDVLSCGWLDRKLR